MIGLALVGGFGIMGLMVLMCALADGSEWAFKKFETWYYDRMYRDE